MNQKAKFVFVCACIIGFLVLMSGCVVICD
jgi:hypothetical protein